MSYIKDAYEYQTLYFFKIQLDVVYHLQSLNCYQNVSFFTAVPGAPDTPKVSNIQATSMTVSWSPPESDGGSKITGYTLEVKQDFSSRWNKIATSVIETSYNVTLLTTGSEYQFRVAAENRAGLGKFSKPSETVVAKPPYGKFVVVIITGYLYLFDFVLQS